MRDKNANYDLMSDMDYLSRKASKVFSHVPYATIYPEQDYGVRDMKSGEDVETEIIGIWG